MYYFFYFSSPAQSFRLVLQETLEKHSTSPAPSDSGLVQTFFSSLRSVLSQIKLLTKTPPPQASYPAEVAGSSTPLKKSALLVQALPDPKPSDIEFEFDEDWRSLDDFGGTASRENDDKLSKKSVLSSNPAESQNKSNQTFSRSKLLLDRLASNLTHLFRDLKKSD